MNKNKQISDEDEHEMALRAYHEDKQRILYKEPVPIIPYPHKLKTVTPYGFVRDELSLPEKVMMRIEND